MISGATPVSAQGRVDSTHDGVAKQDKVPIGTPGAYAPGWSVVHADAANSDYYAKDGASELTLAWSRKFDGLINLVPTSDGQGRLYLTTSGSGCRLHALDRVTGQTIWYSDAVDKLAVASSPPRAFVPGVARYVSDRDNHTTRPMTSTSPAGRGAIGG